MNTENRNILIQALVGSHNYNLNTPTSDEDFKLFVMPTFEDLFKGKFFTNAKVSDTLDFTVHDIRKLTEQLWKSNINFLEVLFSVRERHDDIVNFLFDDAEKWATMNIRGFRNATLGMHRQKMSNLHKGTSNTMKLVEEFGFDTKEACHALRCLFVVEDFWKMGSMRQALWFGKGKGDTNKRNILLKIKAGEVSEEKFRGMVEDWHAKFSVGEMDKNFNDAPQLHDVKQELDGIMFEVIKKAVLKAG